MWTPALSSVSPSSTLTSTRSPQGCPRLSFTFPLDSLPETQVSIPCQLFPISYEVHIPQQGVKVLLSSSFPSSPHGPQHIYTVRAEQALPGESHQQGLVLRWFPLPRRALLPPPPTEILLIPPGPGPVQPQSLPMRLSLLSQAQVTLPRLHANVHDLNFCYGSWHILPCIRSYL